MIVCGMYVVCNAKATREVIAREKAYLTPFGAGMPTIATNLQPLCLMVADTLPVSTCLDDIGDGWLDTLHGRIQLGWRMCLNETVLTVASADSLVPVGAVNAQSHGFYRPVWSSGA